MSASPKWVFAGFRWCALALLCLAPLSGCGSGSSGSATTSTQAPASGGGSTSTATGGAKGSTVGASKVTSTTHPNQASKESTTGQASANPSTPSASTGGRLLRRFTGSGNTRLGTIVVGSRAVLVWRAQRPPIQIFTGKGFILVSGRATVGSIRLSGGTYTGTRVATRGGWTVELRARS